MGQMVLEYRDHKNVYTNEHIQTLRGMELDHVLEIHLLTGVISHMKLTDKPRKQLICELKERVVNEFENLAFTTQDINYKKFKACDAFYQEYVLDKHNENGIFPYLVEANAGGRFSRSVSRRIREEIVSSYDALSYKTANVDFLDNLHDLFIIGMRLG
jgi:hypothetical protein